MKVSTYFLFNYKKMSWHLIDLLPWHLLPTHITHFKSGPIFFLCSNIERDWRSSVLKIKEPKYRKPIRTFIQTRREWALKAQKSMSDYIFASLIYFGWLKRGHWFKVTCKGNKKSVDRRKQVFPWLSLNHCFQSADTRNGSYVSSSNNAYTEESGWIKMLMLYSLCYCWFWLLPKTARYTWFCTEIVVRKKKLNIYGSCSFTWTYNVGAESFS